MDLVIMYTSACYRYSPTSCQELLIFATSAVKKILREGSTFKKMLAEAELRQYLPKRQLHEWRGGQLKLILERAQTDVPYYHRRYNRLPLDNTSPAEVLQYFKFITKKDLIVHGDKFLAKDVPFFRHYTTKTSGTTGTPLTLHKTFHSVNRENAFLWRQLHWANCRQGEKTAWLRGDLVLASHNTQKPPFWRMDHCVNALRMSSYHLSEKSAPSYLAALRKFEPASIQAYPSSIGYLANWLWRRGEQANIPRLKSILTSSETLTAEQRGRIEQTFGVKVFDWYGSSEQVAAIGTCEYGHYHIIEDYSFVELASTSKSNCYEVIGTSFSNELMPLIRYATGDWVELDGNDQPCPCKRQFRRVKRILGRMNDAIQTPDGRSIGLIDPIYNGLPEVAESQIVQDYADSLEIKVVTVNSKPISQLTQNMLINNLRMRIGMDMDVRITQVDSLPRTQNGKVRTIVNKLYTV